MTNTKHYRTIWISDVHLGTRGCKAELLLDFLRHTESEMLYLVGDIVDGWQIKRSWYWVQSHNDVLQKLLRKARKGTRVIYIPGNHDEAMRPFSGLRFGGIEVKQRVMHHTADDKRLLVLHGDEFDAVTTQSRWLAALGDRAYHVALICNRWFNWVRRLMGRPYWSLSTYLKQRVKDAVGYVNGYATAIAAEARRLRVDGVVCRHIHKAEIRLMQDVLYANDGDWVESCTALVEHHDGRLEILDWTTLRQVDLMQECRVDPEPQESWEPQHVLGAIP